MIASSAGFPAGRDRRRRAASASGVRYVTTPWTSSTRQRCPRRRQHRALGRGAPSLRADVADAVGRADGGRSRTVRARAGGGRARGRGRGTRARRGRCCRWRRAAARTRPSPSCPGTTTRSPPATPLLAGSPTVYSHSPAPSYMPQVAMTARARPASWPCVSTRSPVSGLTPPLASVAAMAARSAASIVDRALAEVALDDRVGIAVDGARTPAAGGRWLGCGVRSRAPSPARRGPGRAVGPRSGRTSRPASRAPGRARHPVETGRAAIAPALTIGLSGRPVPGASVMLLNASPVGSTPICARTASSPRSSRTRPYVSGLEIDWMVNGTRLSPTSWQRAVEGHRGDPEP